MTEEGALIAGEGRYKVAQRLGLATVPVIVLAGLSPTKQRALAIADNRIAESSGWDRERLAIEIPELAGLLERRALMSRYSASRRSRSINCKPTSRRSWVIRRTYQAQLA